jgi:hypothetical protein
VKSLAFGRTVSPAGGRNVRSAHFEQRSSLPTSAACVVAATVRESLGALLGMPASVRLLEPAIPSPEAWIAIARDALLFRLRGETADAAIVLRREDALALAAAAFGESSPLQTAVRNLSAIERDVLERTVSALAASLVAVCGGGDRRALERIGTIAGFVTYFELVVEGPADARIGVALSRDPVPERGRTLELEDLLDVSLVPRVELPMGVLETGAAATLSIGTILPIPRRGAFRGSLRFDGRTLARGACGVFDGRYALMTTGGGRSPT